MLVNHNIASMNSLRSLNNIIEDSNNNLKSLSSGLRINSAADGPADLVISEHMRSQISGINQAVKNSETSISMVQTAEGVLSEMNSFKDLENVNNDLELVISQQNKINKSQLQTVLDS